MELENTVTASRRGGIDIPPAYEDGKRLALEGTTKLRTQANQGLQGLSAIGGSETLVTPVNPVYFVFSCSLCARRLRAFVVGF
jgi:hypothetical protein